MRAAGSLRDRMAAQVLRANLRNILDAIPRLGRAPAEIHVFEPYRMKTFVQATQAFPHVAADHQECARGLLHRTFADSDPDPGIDNGGLPDCPATSRLMPRSSNASDAGVGKRRIVNPGLRTAVRPGQLACGESVFPARIDQRGLGRSGARTSGFSSRIGSPAVVREALIHSSGESAIVASWRST